MTRGVVSMRNLEVSELVDGPKIGITAEVDFPKLSPSIDSPGLPIVAEAQAKAGATCRQKRPPLARSGSDDA